MIINGSPIARFVQSYQFDASDEGIVHTPTHAEQCMIEDAICSFISDSELLGESLRALTVGTEPKTEACQTCNGRGEVGGFVNAESGYQTDPCPACAATPPQEPSVQKPVALQIKPLEWVVRPIIGGEDRLMTKDGRYWLSRIGGGFMIIGSDEEDRIQRLGPEVYPTAEAAQAVVQADHERRIAAYLVASPPPSGDRSVKALEVKLAEVEREHAAARQNFITMQQGANTLLRKLDEAKKALEPFGRNAGASSLAKVYAHLTRQDAQTARALSTEGASDHG